MKFCGQCGACNEDYAVFCHKCGAKASVNKAEIPGQSSVQNAPIPSNDRRSVPAYGNENIGANASTPAMEPKVQKPKKKMKKGTLIAIVSLATMFTCAVVAGFFFLHWYFGPQQQVFRALNNGDQDGAVQLVEEYPAMRHDEEFVIALKKRIEAVRSEITEGSKAHAEVLLELDTIKKMDVEEVKGLIYDVRDYAMRLNASRTSFSTGEAFFEDGDYIKAMEQYIQVIEEDSNHKIAKTKYAESVNRYREKILDEAARCVNDESYSGAIKVLKTALTHLPGDAQILKQISLYEKAAQDKRKADILTSAKEHADQEDYIAAMQILSSYAISYGDDGDVSSAYDQYCEKYITAVLEEASRIAASGDYIDAVAAVEKGLESAKGAAKLIERREQYLSKYIEEIIAQSNNFLEKKDYSKAEEVVYKGLENVQENTSLKEQLEKIDAARPKYLLLDVCSPYQYEEYKSYTNGNTFYMGGQSYTDGFRLYYDHGSPYAYFNLDGKYSKLSFMCGHWDGTTMCDATMKVYCDGVLVKEETVLAGGLPEKYELNITGVRQLKICFDSEYRTVVIGFADITVQ